MSNPFSNFHTDIITIFNKDGNIIAENIQSQVTKGNVKTYVTNLVLKEGDDIERRLSNGTKDIYIITEVYLSEAGIIAPAYFDLTIKNITDFNLNKMNPFE